jgi:multidrug efflux pump subunit AcrA (membrane-fusion protein)
MAEPATRPESTPTSRDPVVLLPPGEACLGLPLADLPALRRVRPPAPVRSIAAALGILFPLVAVLLLFVPWQQSALGTGRVIAYAPEDRQQTIESPIKGVILEWHVQEGQLIEKGEPVATLGDNDPAYLGRLESERDQYAAAAAAADEQVTRYERKAASEAAARDLAVAEAEAAVMEARSKLVGLEAEADTAALQLQRIDSLSAEGIESVRKLELARMKASKTAAAVEAQGRYIDSLVQKREKTRTSGDAKVASAEADLEGARAKRAEARSKLLNVETKVARQQAQVVRAPRDGRVFRLHGGPEAAQVKPGDMLVTLVPEAGATAVELILDGNDMPLVQPGEEVRVLFEGWPAIQFSGWPDMSYGTFGGEVAFIDPSDDGKGQFRVVVLPDPDEPAWPSGTNLRQGVRAKGFVLLGSVSLGYELWRQINGFPPMPPVEKGEKVTPPNGKKPRSPRTLQ